MSRSSDARSDTQKPILGAGAEAVADRFHSAVSFGAGDKPDSKYFHDLGSPVSPLGPRAAITNTSSSSSSSGSFHGKPSSTALARRSDAGPAAGRRSHSGELSGSGESSPTANDARNWKPEHRRSGSVGGGGGGGSSSTASSPANNVLPMGNICPSGKIGKPGLLSQPKARSDVLGSGTGNYGHGSVMRGVSSGGSPARLTGNTGMGNSKLRRSMPRVDPEEVTKAANEQYRQKNYAEALRLYDEVITMCPNNSKCRSNRAAALVALGRLADAMEEYERAIQLDPANGKAHLKLGSLSLRMGLVESARRHIDFGSQQPDLEELQKLQAVEWHLGRCADARKIKDWKSALREVDAAIAKGADSSPLLIALRAEALHWLCQPDEADSTLSEAHKFVSSSISSLQTKFFDMHAISYINIVQAQVDMTLGRFDEAVAAAERARQIDPRNSEVKTVLTNVSFTASAREQGHKHFKAGNFADACEAYGKGLKYDPTNPVLHCNRAVCQSKLGQFEKSIEDCNEALRVRPNYTNALRRRADSYSKLARWAESVRDYEALRRLLPDDREVAEGLFHAQVGLKAYRGEDFSDMKFGGEVEEVTSLEQLRAAVSLPGVSVVYFMASSNSQCVEITPFVDALCSKHPSVNFLKVNISESPVIAKAEKVVAVPMFKIYKNGTRAKEMICPSKQNLEHSVKHYSV